MRNRKPMWEIKQQTTPGVLDLYIYGDVEGDGYDWWKDEVIESETSQHLPGEAGGVPWRHPDQSVHQQLRRQRV